MGSNKDWDKICKNLQSFLLKNNWLFIIFGVSMKVNRHWKKLWIIIQKIIILIKKMWLNLKANLDYTQMTG